MSRPNIVLIILDAVRSDHLSCYGYRRETTPEIDRLAREGYRYTNAFSNSNWTGEAHPPIFTGLLPSNSDIYGDNLSLRTDGQTLAELLQDAGYRTFGTSAGGHIRTERGYERGFDEFRETHRIQPNLKTVRKILRESAYRKQVQVSIMRGADDKTLYKFEALKRFMQRDDEPVFAFLNCKTAHFPYNPPRPFKTEFCPGLTRPKYEFLERLFDGLNWQTQELPGIDTEKCRMNPIEFMTDEFTLSEEKWEVVIAWYDGAIRYLDYRIGEFVDILSERGILDNTYLVITADHGEMFGEKGLTSHEFSLYDTLLRVPLIIRPPGGTESEEIHDRVSLVDLFNTVLDMAGAGPVERDHSQSLLSDEYGHEYTFAEIGNKELTWLEEQYEEFESPAEQAGPLQSIRDDTFKLITDRDDHLEMYRWREDPQECDDVSEEYPEARERLWTALTEQTKEMRTAKRNYANQDEELKETLEHLGYR